MHSTRLRTLIRLWRNWSMPIDTPPARHRCTSDCELIDGGASMFLCASSGNVHMCDSGCEHAVTVAGNRFCSLTTRALGKKMVVSAERLMVEFKTNPVSADVLAHTDSDSSNEQILSAFVRELRVRCVCSHVDDVTEEEVVVPPPVKSRRASKKRKSSSPVPIATPKTPPMNWSNRSFDFETIKRITPKPALTPSFCELATKLWPFMMHFSEQDLVDGLCAMVHDGVYVRVHDKTKTLLSPNPSFVASHANKFETVTKHIRQVIRTCSSIWE